MDDALEEVDVGGEGLEQSGMREDDRGKINGGQ